jgi:hypothetical protein
MATCDKNNINPNLKLLEAFGAFESNITAEEEVAEIKAARKFRDKDLSL